MVLKNDRGFALLQLLILAAILPPAVLVASRASDVVAKSAQFFKGNSTKNSMNVIKAYLVSRAADPDKDGVFELLKDDSGSSGHGLPVSLPLNLNDEWTTAYRYCNWDLGSPNGANAGYSQNTASPPGNGIIGQIISAGKDRNFQTSCGDASASGDDILINIYDSDVKSSNGMVGGWSDNGPSVTLLNPADNIGLGVSTPTHKLELASGTTASSGIAIGDAELYRSGANTWALGSNNSLVIPSGTLSMNGSTLVDTSNNMTLGGGMTLSGGTLSMNNGTSNTLIMGAAGVGAPTTVARSAGTKFVLAPTEGAFTTDYALGVENNALWQSVASSGQSFKWYAGTSNIMTLDGGGHIGLGKAPNGSYSLDSVGAINASALYVGGTLVPTLVAGAAPGQMAYWDGSKWTPTSGLTYNSGTGNVSVTAGNLLLGGNTLTTSNTGLISNLNADMVDGYHLNQDVRTSAAPTFAGLTLNGNLALGTNIITSGTWNAATITPAYGGTGITGFTTGDILYASDGLTLARLADIATGNVLTSGGVGAAPTWGKVGLTTHVSGILPVGNGGTGLDGSTAGNGNLLIGNGHGYTLANLTGTANQVNVTNGPGSITLGLPQNIATTSTPTFGGMTLKGTALYPSYGTALRMQSGNIYSRINNYFGSNGNSSVSIGLGYNRTDYNVGVLDDVNQYTADLIIGAGNNPPVFLFNLGSTLGLAPTAAMTLDNTGLRLARGSISTASGSGNNIIAGGDLVVPGFSAADGGTAYYGAFNALNIGRDSTNGIAWMQANGGSGGAYQPIQINPYGGDVIIGSATTDSGDRLQLNAGSFKIYNDTNVAYANCYIQQGLVDNSITYAAYFSQGSGGYAVANLGADWVRTVGGSTIPNGMNFISTSSGMNVNIGNVLGTAGGGVRYYASSNGGNHDHIWYQDRNEKMRLTYVGDLLVGTTTDSGYRLRVNGTGYFDGTLYASGGTWNSSDIRLKRDIMSLDAEGRVVDRIRRLNGVYYYWRTQEFPNRGFDGRRQIGVIAQNVEQVFPELVTTGKDGFKAVAYDKMAAVLLEGMKEQQDQLDNHEKRITATEKNVVDIKDKEIARLNEENTSLQGRIASLEQWVTDFLKTSPSRTGER